VREQHGAAVAELHTVTGDYYGYSGGRTSASTWSVAFAAMVEDLLADAVDWGVRLPVSAEVIRSLVRGHADVLDTVDRPALVHFDGWDGNVLAEPGGDGTLRMTGLVDGERYLFGDPMMDLVSPALFRRIEDEPQGPFLRGYAAAAASGSPLVLDEVLLRRLGLCRLYFHLLMTVEMPSRGITRENDPERHALPARLFEQQVAELEVG
jgi:aminoglycoside phosphotransferase (APT) family kinase protein